MVVSVWGCRPEKTVAVFTCGQVLNPVSVRASSGKLPVAYVRLIALLDGWLVDCSKDIYHVQVGVVVAEEVPANT